ncbi:MAG: tryptophan--tRNA ligase [Bacteroidia bacterium]|nr:tryptophan--tRNA ligase [Bacteroidia bacterium]MCZ2249473.1 tryptophan--tRNA ligase [Bacteroidia bacterium]
MARILTGIQSSGVPHLGNILGAILPAIKISKESGNESFFFIADLHSFTSIKEASVRRYNTNAVAAAWVAFGFDTDKNILYRQSKVAEVCELSWYLNCLTPYPMLANAHSFKDKSGKLADVNAGLFTYPVLMAADILLYNANYVPVGKDQIQHLEITRDIALKFNSLYGETFVVPEAITDTQVMIVPGTDGQKMSKSYHNFIDIFKADNELLKDIKSIVTDSLPLEAPKDPEACNVFKIYKLIANDEQINTMRNNYIKGGYGYGHAKKELYELIVSKFATQREEFKFLMSNESALYHILEKGENKAREYAQDTLSVVRKKLGYS